MSIPGAVQASQSKRYASRFRPTGKESHDCESSFVAFEVFDFFRLHRPRESRDNSDLTNDGGCARRWKSNLLPTAYHRKTPNWKPEQLPHDRPHGLYSTERANVMASELHRDNGE
jgi:hypothetical protein